MVDEPRRPYHHGALREALLEAALEAVQRDGPANLSLRALARQVGVSSAAPVHHFGDKAGLLTAIAVDGFERLHRAMAAAWAAEGRMLAVGVAYVGFAAAHPAHFNVMFRSDLLHRDDPDLVAARRATAAVQREAAAAVAGPDEDPRLVAVAGWALMHGVTALWADDLLPADLAADPAALARRLGGFLFTGRAAGP